MEACVEAVGDGCGRANRSLAAGCASAQDDIGADLGAAERVVAASVRECVGVDAGSPGPELVHAVLAFQESFQAESSRWEVSCVVAAVAVQIVIGEDHEIECDAAEGHLALEGPCGGDAARECGDHEPDEEGDDGDGGEQFDERVATRCRAFGAASR